LEERRLLYGILIERPLGIIPWDLHLIRKVIWFKVFANWIFRCSSFLNEGYIPGPYPALST
jgi:hypothetical protein